MSQKYWRTPELRLSYKPSKYLGWCVAALFSLTVGLLGWSGITPLLWLPLVILAGLTTVFQWLQINCRCLGHPVAHLVYKCPHWCLYTAAGERIPLLPPERVINGRFVLAAVFPIPGARSRSYPLLLLFDSVDRETWRRAALALRYGARDAGCNTVSLGSDDAFG